MSARRPTSAIIGLVALLVAAALLLAVELGLGAASYGSGKLADPCRPHTFSGGGLDATIQQIVLDGLDGAACRLHTTREELVLSFGSGTGYPPRRWDKQTIEKAVRAGMLAAVSNAESRGQIPGFVATLLRNAIEAAPLDKLIQGSISLGDLFG